MHFGCYGNLKVALTYNGKSENWDLLPSHCSYFDISFTEMFVEWISIKHIILSNLPIWLVAMSTERLNLQKNI